MIALKQKLVWKFKQFLSSGPVKLIQTLILGIGLYLVDVVSDIKLAFAFFTPEIEKVFNLVHC